MCVKVHLQGACLWLIISYDINIKFLHIIKRNYLTATVSVYEIVRYKNN